MIARPIKITRNEFFVVIAIVITTVVLAKGLFDLYVRHFDPDFDSLNQRPPPREPRFAPRHLRPQSRLSKTELTTTSPGFPSIPAGFQ